MKAPVISSLLILLTVYQVNAENDSSHLTNAGLIPTAVKAGDLPPLVEPDENFYKPGQCRKWECDYENICKDHECHCIFKDIDCDCYTRTYKCCADKLVPCKCRKENFKCRCLKKEFECDCKFKFFKCDCYDKYVPCKCRKVKYVCGYESKHTHKGKPPHSHPKFCFKEKCDQCKEEVCNTCAKRECKTCKKNVCETCEKETCDYCKTSACDTCKKEICDKCHDKTCKTCRTCTKTPVKCKYLFFDCSHEHEEDQSHH